MFLLKWDDRSAIVRVGRGHSWQHTSVGAAATPRIFRPVKQASQPVYLHSRQPRTGQQNQNPARTPISLGTDAPNYRSPCGARACSRRSAPKSGVRERETRRPGWRIIHGSTPRHSSAFRNSVTRSAGEKRRRVAALHMLQVSAPKTHAPLSLRACARRDRDSSWSWAAVAFCYKKVYNMTTN